MGVLTGIAAIAAETAPREAQPEREKVDWMKLEAGQTVQMRFVNELDANSAHFDPERGLAVLVPEHQSPADFKRKAQCSTTDQGRCWACEQVDPTTEAGRKWRAKKRFYINVLIDGEVKVWSMGTYNNPTFEYIKEYFMDTGAITNLSWKLKRNGTGTETSYVLMPQQPDKKPFEWKDVKGFDLQNIVISIPYDNQPRFYGVAQKAEASNITEEAQGESTTSPAIQW